MIRTLLLSIIVIVSIDPSYANDDCFVMAGKMYTIDPVLLKAISYVESAGNNQARNQNQNGTFDMCSMQINSVHLPRLKAWGITEETLATDECTCILTGAFLLAENVAYVGRNWSAVGFYHTGRNGSTKRAAAYARKVRNIYLKMQHNR